MALRVNGVDYRIDIEPRAFLLDVLRDELSLTGTKKVCDNGQCGACSVIIDDKLVYSCLTLAIECEGKEIRTIEGLSAGGQSDPVQQAFIQEDGYQCGFCTPGQVMAVTHLLEHNPEPTLDEVKRGVSGNLCRCGAYPKIFEAALAAADLKRKVKHG
ncbi:MAG: (2Fe-2S)-binding protein [Spirochaetales bacterium]|nr:(2Fe-2S)-binding protein [Spirochaetales bacterium]